MDVHPILVHFPIVLLLVGVVFDAIGILGNRPYFLRTGFLLFALGALAAIPAALSGDQAADTTQHIAGVAADLDWHNTLGTTTALLAVFLTLLRAHLTFRRRFAGPVRALYLAGAVGAALLVAASGYTGGRLVYDHGAGTHPVIRTLKIEPDSPARLPRSDTFQSQ
ncbi:MAG: DUF2231 domain-containing protein [bacterium]|nr:DUF2231 domain-containing protein [bacterium]